MYMYKDDNCLFSRKDMYVMQHDAHGRNLEWADVSTRIKRKAFRDNLHLLYDVPVTSKLGFPQLQAYTGDVDFVAIPYTERNKKGVTGEGQAVHFFIDDYRFGKALWDNLEKVTYGLKKFGVCFAPNYSLYKDAGFKFANMQNTYKSRAVGAYWQKCGYKVIPTAAFGCLESFDYCFEGLPSESVIAVSGMGCRRDSNTFAFWCEGLRRLEDAKHPILVLVYGPEVDVPGLNTPLKFIPDFISTRLRTLRG